jgi:opacity protein-like surface antigen
MLVLVSSAAHAQSAFTGFATGHLGAASSGDVRNATLTAGGSIAVIDASGLGAEIDLSHSGDFDDAQFADSSITSLMVNIVSMYPHETIRPFVTAGAGVMRLRATFPGQAALAQTDTGWTLGAGLLYMWNEALGFRGDVRYFRQFGRQTTFPLGGDGRLNFIRTSFGVTYSWPLY